jgi:hypothetical protein
LFITINALGTYLQLSLAQNLASLCKDNKDFIQPISLLGELSMFILTLINEENITLNGGSIGLTSTKKYALHLHLTIGLKS